MSTIRDYQLRMDGYEDKIAYLIRDIERLKLKNLLYKRQLMDDGYRVVEEENEIFKILCDRKYHKYNGKYSWDVIENAVSRYNPPAVIISKVLE